MRAWSRAIGFIAPALAPALAAALACGACKKLPLTDVGAGFTLSDASWFAEEETLFIFYRVEAQQGLGPFSQIEITYRTDTTLQPWTPIGELTTVHTHLPVDCGIEARCGSTSLHVADPVREVGVRLRYHREGEMVLPADTRLNIIGPQVRKLRTKRGWSQQKLAMRLQLRGC